ncbi:hypothetical protein MATL_G00159130 [Megalops atlanticus]|uniref:TRASH domain-containing protein n=1 Tax=Megalops atlanticus TaxID=7932 RepID=A0A9D3PQP6_MEGAT|nr:hypothetical protein MATL_G00159130 [Megalops atlanticus]
MAESKEAKRSEDSRGAESDDGEIHSRHTQEVATLWDAQRPPLADVEMSVVAESAGPDRHRQTQNFSQGGGGVPQLSGSGGNRRLSEESKELEMGDAERAPYSPRLDIKDEPIDEEYDRALLPHLPPRCIKDEPDAPEELVKQHKTLEMLKITSVFSVRESSASSAAGPRPASGGGQVARAIVVLPRTPQTVPPPAPPSASRDGTPLSTVRVSCSECTKVLQKGQTAFQRKGSSQLFCSTVCLTGCNLPATKSLPKKTCHECLKEIANPKDLIISPVDIAGTMKDFCSQRCLSEFRKKVMASMLSVLTIKCSVCRKTAIMCHEVNYQGAVHKLCSNTCFSRFLSSNNLTTNCCETCGNYCYSANGQCHLLQIEGTTRKFCSPVCLTIYKQKLMKVSPCAQCGTPRLWAEMVESAGADGKIHLYCSMGCAASATPRSGIAGAVPFAFSQTKINGDASTLTDAMKPPAAPRRVLKNKALLCKPISQNKGTLCKPQLQSRGSQTDQGSTCSGDLESEGVSTPHSWEEESTVSNQQLGPASDPEGPLSTPGAHTQLNLETDFPIESLEPTSTKELNVMLRNRGRRGPRDDFPLRKRVMEEAYTPTTERTDEMSSGRSAEHLSQQTSTHTTQVQENSEWETEILSFEEEERVHSTVLKLLGTESVICDETILGIRDDRSSSSIENSEDDYVPDSADESSSDDSTYHHERSFKERTALKKSKFNKVMEKSSFPDLVSESSSAEETQKSEEAPDECKLISVQAVSKTPDGNRVYNKKHYCMFCFKSLSRMARHLEQVHSNEPEVAKALLFPKRSRERKIQLQRLRNRGNFVHNVDVLQSGSGDLVPYKQPRNKSDSKDFMHCSSCQGFFSRKFLWHHMKRCRLKPHKNSTPTAGRNRVQSMCAFAGPVPHGVSSGLWKLLSVMTQDEVLQAITTDTYIIKLGEHFYNKLGSDGRRPHYVRQKLRGVGRLLLQARKHTPLRKMEDFIDPSNFMHIVTAVKMVSGYDEDKCTFQSPSLAMTLGRSVQKIASLVAFQAKIDGDSGKAQKTRNFKEMYQSKWNELLFANALRTLQEEKWNVPQVLPFTEDVKKMHLYLDKKQDEHYHSLSTEASSKNWTALAKVLLTQIILFNRRREGEVSKMLLSSFVPKETEGLHEDIALALSELEKKLCDHFTRIEIRGKRGRKVPILLTPAMQKGMELLKQKREACEVPPENIYMFARPNALSHYRGSDCLRVFAKECGAKNPKALSSTKLHKHVAMLSKVLNLNDTKLDELADFLGHDIRVHREYYRLPEGTLQLAKISKILMALETGGLGEFKGKKLEDIDIDPNEKLQVHDYGSGSEDESGDEQEEEEECGPPPQQDSTVTSVSSISEECGPPPQQDLTVTSVFSISEDICIHLRRKAVKRRKWEDTEVKAVEKHLGKFIRTHKVPGKSDCEACICAEPHALRDRDWSSVKFFVKNRITALKRKL